jgi:hypothetical protein
MTIGLSSRPCPKACIIEDRKVSKHTPQQHASSGSRGATNHGFLYASGHVKHQPAVYLPFTHLAVTPHFEHVTGGLLIPNFLTLQRTTTVPDDLVLNAETEGYLPF